MDVVKVHSSSFCQPDEPCTTRVRGSEMGTSCSLRPVDAANDKMFGWSGIAVACPVEL